MENGISITPQTIISFAALLAAVFAIFKYYNKGYDLVKHQKEQDDDIKAIKRDSVVNTRVMRVKGYNIFNTH